MTEFFAAAYVKSLESKMLSDKDFEDMLRISEEEAQRRLTALGYEGTELDEMTEREAARVREICMSLCGDDRLRYVISAQADFHNIRAVIKAESAGKNALRLTEAPSVLDIKELIRAVQAESFGGLGEPFSELCENAFRLYRKHTGACEPEVYLEKQCMLYMLENSKGNAFAHGWAELFAELYEKKEYERKRLKTGEEAYEKSREELSKYCDDRLTEYLRRAHFSFCGLDSVLAFYEGKKIEIKNLRLLLYAYRTGNRTEAEKRLRRTYV